MNNPRDLSTTTLQELFDVACENAANVFNKTHEVLPIWHAIAGNNEHHLLATPWTNEAEKEETTQALRCLFSAMSVKRFAFIAEVWTVDARHDLREALKIKPSKHPDRREALRIHCEDRDGSTLSGHYFILRPEHGPPKLSSFHQDEQATTFEGRFTGMLT